MSDDDHPIFPFPKHSCTKCLDLRDHPWHDNGTVNEEWEFRFGDRPPEHVMETN